MCKNCTILLKSLSQDLAYNHTEWFVQAVLSFIDFLKKYFDAQAEEYISSLSQYPELKIQKISDEEKQGFYNFIEDFFLLWVSEEQQNIALDLLRSGYDNTSEKLQLLDNSRAVEYAQDHSGELIKQINTTTQTEMSEIITSGIKNSQTIQEITENIQEKFKSYNLYRSTLIATMEVANAYSEAQKQVYEEVAWQLWVIGWKRAITQKDENVRASHKTNEDAWWIPRTQAYPWTGSMQAPYWFFCRCSDDYSLTNPDTGLLYDDVVEYSDTQKDDFFEVYGDPSLYTLKDKEEKSYTDSLWLISQEVAAIQKYTLGTGDMYNEWFKIAEPVFTTSIPFFIWGISKLPKYSGITYRGAWNAWKYKKLKVWEIFKPDTLFSSSISEDIAHEFRKEKNGTIFVINSLKWKDLNILWVQREKEVLFLPKTLFKVEKVENGKDYLTIYLTDL